MKLRRVIAWGAGVVALAATIDLTISAKPYDRTPADEDIPVATVRRGDLDLNVYTTGELRASHAATLTAPAIGGDTLKIIHLIHSGARVRKGDMVIEFDPIEQRFKFEQSRSELLQAERDITKAEADYAVQAAQDKVALLKARFDVRRAELEVQKNELASTIDANKNQLALQEAQRALVELEQDIKSHASSGQAGIDLAQEKWKKANLAMQQAEANIQKMRIPSPIDGLVAIEKNFDANGGQFFGTNAPDYHEGDQVRAGSLVAQVIDPRELQLTATVSEQERTNIAVGNPVEAVFDALPDRTFHGAVQSASGIAQRHLRDYFLGNGGKFDIAVQLTDIDTRLRPGLTAEIVIDGGKRASVLYIFRQALFQKDGKQIVYLQRGGNVEQRQVKITGENESRMAVEGLRVGDEVALVDPTVPRRTSGRELPPPSSGETP